MSSEELEAMRDEQEKNMPETVYIQRLMRTSDSAGGWSEAWQTVATTQGRVAAARGRELELGSKLTSAVTYTVTLPHDAVVEQTDQLQINGQQYQVLAILNRSEKTALRVICEKIE